MTNMIQNAKEQAAALAMAAYRAAAADGTLPEAEVKTAPVEIPKDTANGDYTTTFALAAAKALGKPPRVIAQALLDHMDLTGTYFTSAEIAGPGFLNFRLGNEWYAGVMNAVETEGDAYGTNESLKGQKIMVEFVSANPTGPMHMGNARGGVLGDTLASVLTACGADVTREFYVNDAGHQIDKFARSIEVRYLQLINGEDSIAFPEDGYQGEDIKELAKAYYDENGDKLLNVSEQERQTVLAQYGLSVNLPRMKADLERYKIHYDNWFYESSLHESGYVAETVALLTERGWTYEKEGALWLKTADIMREQYRKQGKKDEDIDKLETDKKNCRAKAYDIVLNGTELGGGSIRISVPETQEAMFRALGFTNEDAQERFGHLINAFKFGAPPHGGLAYGLDRLCMLMAGAESIRDVIAFPKVQNASEPMTSCPDFVDDKQLDELNLNVTRREETSDEE